MNKCRSVEEAEGQAILMGLVSLSRLYQGPLIIETDIKMIANELGQARSSRSDCFLGCQ